MTRNQIDDSVPLLSELFKAAGYHTAHFGKWHVGPDSEMARRGFDHVLSLPHYREHLRESQPDIELTSVIARDYIHSGYPFAAITSGSGDDIFEIWCSKQVEQWLRAQVAAREPFFCCVSLPGPHPGYMVPSSYAARYDPKSMPLWPNLHDDLDDKPRAHRIWRDLVTQAGTLTEDEWRTCIARYYAYTTLVDEQLGYLLDVLDELDVSKDTLVLFVSDHGDLVGAHGLFDKGPMMYEEQLHIPLVARWPGVLAAAETCDAMLSVVDLMPTLAAAAGLDLPRPVDGRSLMPIVRGEAVSDWPDDVFVQYSGEGIGLCSIRVVRSRRFKYVYCPFDVDELYDEEVDPWELRNLAEDRGAAPVLAEMRGRLARWMERTEDVMLEWNIGLAPKRPFFQWFAPPDPS